MDTAAEVEWTRSEGADYHIIEVVMTITSIKKIDDVITSSPGLPKAEEREHNEERADCK